jgi:uncharacterized protein YjbI with pentapeptide repeats
MFGALVVYLLSVILTSRQTVRQPDVRAALTVLARGGSSPNRTTWLSVEPTSSDWRRAELTNVDLRRVRLADCLQNRADLARAELRGTDLRRPTWTLLEWT